MVDFQPVEEAVFGKDEWQKVERMCLCPTCPSFPEEDHGGKKAYCLRGDSAHKASIEPAGCYCEGCEIYKHGKLYGANFFCLEGAALKQGLRNLLAARPIVGLVEEKERKSPALFVSAGLDVHEP